MPQKREWTSAEHELLRQLLSCHTRTVDIAARFQVSPAHMRQHINDIGLTPTGWQNRLPKPVEQAVFAIPESQMQNWWPLPAGREVTWSAITKNTCHEGAPYQP